MPHADLTTYPPAKLKSELAKAESESSAICDAMIDAGRGHERPSETRLLNDPLALRWRASGERMVALMGERERRLTYHGSIKRTKTS